MTQIKQINADFYIICANPFHLRHLRASERSRQAAFHLRASKRSLPPAFHLRASKRSPPPAFHRRQFTILFFRQNKVGEIQPILKSFNKIVFTNPRFG